MKKEIIEGLKKLYEEWHALTTGNGRPSKRLQIITIELINRMPTLIGEIELLEKRDAIDISPRQIGKMRKAIQEVCKSLEVRKSVILVAEKYVIMDRQSYNRKLLPQLQNFQSAIREIRERIATADLHSFYDYSDCVYDIKLRLKKLNKQIMEGH